MNGRYFFAEAFSAGICTGSPTTICVFDELPATNEMQLLAYTFNYPVTAFTTGKRPLVSIRYFTPQTEIEACGHATLAAAAVLLGEEDGHVNFITVTGKKIPVSATGGLISMHYPVYAMQDRTPSVELLHALQIPGYIHSGFCSELDTLFIQLADPYLLTSIQPEFEVMMHAEPSLKEVVIHCSNPSEADFILRSFCPWIGINEDPVTGSVHSALTPYWSKQLNKKQMKAYQASSRGGHVYLEHLVDGVMISGYCSHSEFILQAASL